MARGDSQAGGSRLIQNHEPSNHSCAREARRTFWYVGGSLLAIHLLPAWLLILYLLVLVFKEVHMLESFTDNVPAFAVLLFAPAITYYFVWFTTKLVITQDGFKWRSIYGKSEFSWFEISGWVEVPFNLLIPPKLVLIDGILHVPIHAIRRFKDARSLLTARLGTPIFVTPTNEAASQPAKEVYEMGVILHQCWISLLIFAALTLLQFQGLHSRVVTSLSFATLLGPLVLLAVWLRSRRHSGPSTEYDSEGLRLKKRQAEDTEFIPYQNIESCLRFEHGWGSTSGLEIGFWDSSGSWRTELIRETTLNFDALAEHIEKRIPKRACDR